MSLRNDQTRFFGKLASLMEAEVPLLNAFEVASDGVMDAVFKAALERILSRAYGGTQLTDAIAEEGAVFSPEVMCLLRHGESTGDLEMKSRAIASGLSDGTFEAGRLEGSAEGTLLDALLADAADAGATDIHIEPVAGGAEVRFRVKGKLVPHRTLSHTEAGVTAILTKRAADLDAAVTNRPQSGSFLRDGRGVRVAVCPYAGGEGIVLRTVWRTGEAGLEGLNLGDDRTALVVSWLAEPRGIILVASPPSGGRVQTIESLLASLDREARKVIAIERGDRVQLPGLGRLRIDPESGFSAADALRATLAQDLDAAAVIEPVTPEVAEVALGAALSGHQVILAVNARGPVEAITSVAGMVTDTGALAEALVGVVAVRRVPMADWAGTVPIHEVIGVSKGIRSAVRRGAGAEAVTGALPQSRRTLRAEAERLVGEGVVSASEVERAFG